MTVRCQQTFGSSTHQRGSAAIRALLPGFRFRLKISGSPAPPSIAVELPAARTRSESLITARSDEPRQHLARLSRQHFIEERAVRGLLWPYVDRLRTISASHFYEACGRLDHARCADGQQHGCSCQLMENQVHLEGNLTKPTDVRTNQCTARVTERNFFSGLIRIRVVKRSRTASSA